MKRPGRGTKTLGKYFRIVVLLTLWAIFPFLGEDKHYVGLVALIGIYAIMAMGFDLLMGYTGLLSLGQMGFAGVGGYLSGLLTAHYHWPFLPALGVALATSLALAYVVGLAVLRLRGYYLALATLALGVIMEELFTNLPVTGGPSGLTGIPGIASGSWAVPSDIASYYLVWAILAVILVFLRNVVNSKTGRAWRAIAGDQLSAAILGIDVAQYKMKAFLLSTVLAALGGSLLAAYMNFISPDMVGLSASLNLVVMVALGGPGTLIGSILGAALLIFLPDVFMDLRDYQILLNGFILVLTMILLPDGLYGGFAFLWARATTLRRKKEITGAAADQEG